MTQVEENTINQKEEAVITRLYDENEPEYDYNEKSFEGNKTSSKLIFGMVMAIFIFNFFFFLFTSNLEPGSGMVLLPLLPFIWGSWMLGIAIFTVLAMQYSREKSNMYYLDKITFYILFIPFLFFTLFIFHRMFELM